MKRPRLFTKPFRLAALFVCAFSFSFGASGEVYAQQQQQPSSQKLYERAKQQYESNSYAQALETIEGLLKDEADYAPALLLKTKTLIGLFVEAPPPPPHAPNFAEAHRERRIRLAKLLNEAAESLERFLQLKPDVEQAESLHQQLSTLRVYAEPATKPESEWTIFSPTEVTEKAQILRRPEPLYPREARSSQANGRVKLLLVLGADSTVKHILALRSSHPLFTEASVQAARRIVFEPAIKDGRPVSTAVSIEYNFQTY